MESHLANYRKESTTPADARSRTGIGSHDPGETRLVSIPPTLVQHTPFHVFFSLDPQAWWVYSVRVTRSEGVHKLMRIDCYLSPGCASQEALQTNITQALEIEKVGAELTFHRIDDNKAFALGVTGSPSVFINGKELQPQGSVGFS